MIYFAYGSMMDRDRLAALCPGVKPLSAAMLPHHVVAFAGRSSDWDGGTATIQLAAGSELWGGLYEIDDECRAKLVASHVADGYVWSSTEVETAEGGRIRAGLLIKVHDLGPTKPSPAYIRAMKEGWKQWGLDPDALLHGMAGGE